MIIKTIKRRKPLAEIASMSRWAARKLKTVKKTCFSVLLKIIRFSQHFLRHVSAESHLIYICCINCWFFILVDFNIFINITFPWKLDWMVFYRSALFYYKFAFSLATGVKLNLDEDEIFNGHRGRASKSKFDLRCWAKFNSVESSFHCQHIFDFSENDSNINVQIFGD